MTQQNRISSPSHPLCFALQRLQGKGMHLGKAIHDPLEPHKSHHEYMY